MKKFSAVLIFISSLFLLSACGSSSSSGSSDDEYATRAEQIVADFGVDFPDANFRACIVDTVADDLREGGDASADYDLAVDLAGLYCQDLGIAGVSGIDSLTGLTNLNLDGNGLEDGDLDDITSLGLYYLNLSNNNLTDPDLSTMDELASLYLSGNKLDSLTVYDLGSLHSITLYDGDDDPAGQLTLADVQD